MILKRCKKCHQLFAVNLKSLLNFKFIEVSLILYIHFLAMHSKLYRNAESLKNLTFFTTKFWIWIKLKIRQMYSIDSFHVNLEFLSEIWTVVKFHRFFSPTDSKSLIQIFKLQCRNSIPYWSWPLFIFIDQISYLLSSESGIEMIKVKASFLIIIILNPKILRHY